MNWLSNILEEIKWKIQDVVWAVQDRYTLWKELKAVEKDLFEEVEVKPKKKNKKNVKKSK